MARTHVRRRRTAVVVLALGLTAVVTGPVARAVGSGPQMAPAADRSYVVEAGDTLWSIAARISPGSDPRPLVEAIEDANGVDPGSLTPGQTLTIPVR